MNDKELQPVEQHLVNFYDDQIIALVMPDGSAYIPLRHICAMIGVDWPGQRRRVLNDPVIAPELETIEITVEDKYRTVRRAMLCVPLDLLSGFLFGINANRVRQDLREPLMRYQREAYKVLDEAVRSGRLRLDDRVINEVITEVRSLTTRVATLEEKLGDTGRMITPEQAQRIATAVKQIAVVLGERSGRNEFGGVYGELHRRFGVPEYKALPASRFNECIGWLIDWYQLLTDAHDTPF